MNIITVDNSVERKKIKNLFEDGDRRYNNGQSYSEKDAGITLILQGLKLLKNLYETSKNLYIFLIILIYLRGNR